MLSSVTNYPSDWFPTIGACGLPVHLQQTILKEDEEDIAAERRILYMAMSHAREKLYMTYFGKLPVRMRIYAGRI